MGSRYPPCRATNPWLPVLTQAVPGRCQSVPGAAPSPAPDLAASPPNTSPPHQHLPTAISFFPKIQSSQRPGKCPGQAVRSPCSRRLWSSLHCWLIPQSLLASQNSSVLLVWAPLHAGKQPRRFTEGFGGLWRGSGGRGSVSLWAGGTCAVGWAWCARCRLC